MMHINHTQTADNETVTVEKREAEYDYEGYDY